MKYKILFSFSDILREWDCIYAINPTLGMTETGLPVIVNIMAADSLVMQGARASAAMVLIIGQVNLEYSLPAVAKLCDDACMTRVCF